jgi:hypothetical protein
MRRTGSRREITHDTLGIKLTVVGARAAQTGPCFVVTEESAPNRERMFLTSCFSVDIPLVEREALYLALVEKEIKRVKNKSLKDAAREKARVSRARAESDAEEKRTYRDLGAESKAEYEPDDPLQPIEESESIVEADSEGHESLSEIEEEEFALEEE